MATTSVSNAPMTAEEKKVIFASSLGTVFEWYDFYLVRPEQLPQAATAAT